MDLGKSSIFKDLPRGQTIGHNNCQLPADQEVGAGQDIPEPTKQVTTNPESSQQRSVCILVLELGRSVINQGLPVHAVATEVEGPGRSEVKQEPWHSYVSIGNPR